MLLASVVHCASSAIIVNSSLKFSQSRKGKSAAESEGRVGAQSVMMRNENKAEFLTNIGELHDVRGARAGVDVLGRIGPPRAIQLLSRRLSVRRRHVCGAKSARPINSVDACQPAEEKAPAGINPPAFSKSFVAEGEAGCGGTCDVA